MNTRILIADDDESVRRTAARALADAATEIVAAPDGMRALELADAASFDLALLDVHMPEADGWQVLDALRANAATRLMPVIVMSGDPANDAATGLDRGADDCVAKPFLPRELAARARGLLRRHRLALAASPLTGLPGSPAIQEEVERRLALERPFALFHVDLDRFKAFNDAFGFARGDELLREVGLLLRQCAGAGFAGHVGGDDFVLVVDAAEALAAARRLTSVFDAMAPGFYQAGERRSGPIVTLSAGAASSEQGPFKSYAQAAALASEMKSHLKARRADGASAFAFDRRRRGPSAMS